MSTVTVNSNIVRDIKTPSLGAKRTGTCGVTNGSAAVTFATALPAAFRGRVGFQFMNDSTF